LYEKTALNRLLEESLLGIPKKKNDTEGDLTCMNFQISFCYSQVFARLFEYISVEDLKAVRLVTRVWHEEATCLLSSRIHGILLHDKIDWKRFLKLLSKSSSSPKLSGLNHIHPFHSFVFFSSYPEDPADTPYKTAILDYMHSKYRLPRMRAFWDEKFFTTYGHQISALKFIQFNLYTEKALREFRELLSIHTPNLESLTLQLQRDSAGSGGSAGQTTSNSTPPSTTPTPTPSPSPLAIPGNDNVFFPPNAESQMKTLANLKRFVFKTDNKYYVNPHALEEFMSLMPSLEEFTYRYTGAKKQWTLMRKVDIIDVLCSVINGGHYKSLKVMDLDSNGTVLSGEDFKKISNLCNNGGDNDESDYRPNYDSSEQSSIVLRKFSCQVFIKNEQDWSYFCAWLRRIHESLRVLDIQVRTASPQIPCESELPLCFANVSNAKLILDNNLHVFLRRLPNVVTFSGIYDNELFPLQSSSASFGYEQHYEPNLEEEKEESASNKSREDESRETFFNTINEHELPSCPSAKYLRIYGNEEVMLDIEWKAGVFRNIVSLETDVYFDNDLRLVWVHLREKLTRLVIHLKGPIPEEAFTGAGLPPVNNFDEKHPMTYHDEEHLAALAEYPNMSFMSSEFSKKINNY